MPGSLPSSPFLPPSGDLSAGGAKAHYASQQPGLSHTGAPAALAHLPAERVRLLGRANESAALLALLRADQPRLVTISGIGGAGKTTLALHVAWKARPFFSGGVIFVNLAPLLHAHEIPDAIVQAIRAADARKSWLQTDSLIDFLAERRLLLILDNLEHLAEQAAPQVAALLDGCPHLHILATSREALRLRGEHIMPAPPLSLPKSGAKADVAHSPAAELFVQQCKSANANFQLTAENAAAVAEICRRLDGLPLALELAARWSRVFTPHALLERLQTNPMLNILSGGERDLPARQQTLRAAIGWSYTLLSPAQQQVLGCAAAFPAAFNLPIFAQAAALDELSAMQHLAALVEKNLLLPLDEAGEPRFGMLETVRQFALEQLDATGGRAAVLGEMCVAFAGLVSAWRAHLQGPDQTRYLNALQADYDNMHTAARSAAHSPDPRLWRSSLKLAGELEFFWLLRGHATDGYDLLTHLVARAEASPEPVDRASLAQAYSTLGTLSWERSDFVQSAHHHLTGLALFRSVNNEEGIAATLGNLAIYFNNIGHIEQAEALYQQSLAFARRSGSRFRQAQALNNLGVLFEERREYETARQHYQAALELTQESGAPLLQCISHLNLGDLARREGRFDEAHNLYEETMGLCRRHENEYMLVNVLAQLAALALVQGQVQAAAQQYQAVLPLAHEIGSKIVLARIYDGLGLARGSALPSAAAAARPTIAASCAKIFGVALRLRQESNSQRWPDLQTLGEAVQTNLIQALGPRRWAACLAEGKHMRLPEAFDMVMETPIDDALNTALEAAQEKHGYSFPKTPWDDALDESSDPAGMAQEGRASADFGAAGAAGETTLTRAEFKIALLVAQGKSNEQIAAEQVVVIKTVEKHITSILRKLQLNNRTELAAWVIKRHNQSK